MLLLPSWRRILPDNPAHALLVFVSVLLIQIVRVGLGGRVRVGVVEQILDAQQDLLDSDGGPPGLLLVQDRQANGAARVDVGVKQRRLELACERWG